MLLQLGSYQTLVKSSASKNPWMFGEKATSGCFMGSGLQSKNRLLYQGGVRQSFSLVFLFLFPLSSSIRRFLMLRRGFVMNVGSIPATL